MKKLIVVSLSLLSVTSCSEHSSGTKAPSQSRLVLDTTSLYYDQNYEVYNLDGCEYIKIGYGKYSWGSHKGNCKNAIHQNEEIQKLQKYIDELERENQILGSELAQREYDKK